jgi:aminopeptidase YwaD
MISEEEKEIQNAIHAKNMYKYVENLCKCGDRFFGSDSDWKAVKYLEEEFDGMGLGTIRDEMTLPTVLKTGPSSVEIPDTDDTFCAQPILFCPPTPEEGITGELVYVGDGGEADFDRNDVKGKIVLSNGGHSAFLEGRAIRAKLHGAKGFIEIHTMPYSGWASFDAYDVEGKFLDELVPSVSVSAFDGFTLIHKSSSQKVQVTLRASTEIIKKAKTCFLRGILTGKEKPEERIVVTAHRDTGYCAGADDDAAGTAIMMEIARVLSRKPVKRTVEFISSTAEETDASLGTETFLTMHEDTISQIKAVFNCEQPSIGGPLFLAKGAVHPDYGKVEHTEWINSLLVEIADSLGYSIKTWTPELMPWVGEEGRYYMRGIPVVMISKYGMQNPYYHTVEDTPEVIDSNSLKVAADIMGIGVWRLANAKVINP